MKNSKKSAAGLVAACLSFGGENKPASKGLNAKTVVFCSPAMIPISEWKIGLSGLKNGY